MATTLMPFLAIDGIHNISWYCGAPIALMDLQAAMCLDSLDLLLQP
ncbi:hypothetical protein [Aestuariibacter sp. A3R04]|nr:hypothetical protein [Aestuariibacter sp. A3R04]MBU3021664.1 hypothetical protein [Aestuariibacter sp. A3R04]